MKKILKLIPAIILGITLVLGCSDSSDSASEQSDILKVLILLASPSCSVSSTESSTSGCTDVTTKCCKSSDPQTCTYNTQTSCN